MAAKSLVVAATQVVWLSSPSLVAAADLVTGIAEAERRCSR